MGSHRTPGPDPTEDGLSCDRVPCDDGLLEFEGSPDATWDHLEFCIPSGERYRSEVARVYPEVTFLPEAEGQVACGPGSVRCSIEWRHADRWKLCRLTSLGFVGEVHGKRRGGG